MMKIILILTTLNGTSKTKSEMKWFQVILHVMKVTNGGNSSNKW